MLLDRDTYSESGYIGAEFFSDSDKDHLHKCLVAEQSIADGDFSLDEALEAYQLSKEDYENYIAKKSNANIFLSISGGTTSISTIAMPTYIEVFAKMLDSSFDERLHTLVGQRLGKIKRELQQISKEIEESKEKA